MNDENDFFATAFFGASGSSSAGSGNVSAAGSGVASAGAPSRPMKPGPASSDGFGAPNIRIRLPSASVPIADLRVQDFQIREQFGKKTLSGRSALSTH